MWFSSFTLLLLPHLQTGKQLWFIIYFHLRCQNDHTHFIVHLFANLLQVAIEQSIGHVVSTVWIFNLDWSLQNDFIFPNISVWPDAACLILWESYGIMSSSFSLLLLVEHIIEEPQTNIYSLKINVNLELLVVIQRKYRFFQNQQNSSSGHYKCQNLTEHLSSV